MRTSSALVTALVAAALTVPAYAAAAPSAPSADLPGRTSPYGTGAGSTNLRTPGVSFTGRPTKLPRAGKPAQKSDQKSAKKSAKGPKLTVDLSKANHPISPLIYGVNFADQAFAADVGLPVDRWGGNSTETYNYLVRGSNHGQDYYFTNFADCWEPQFDYCASGHDYSAVNARIAQDRATHTATLLTLPLLGYVARSVSYTGDHPCSYPSSAFPTQDDHDPFHTSCGNGKQNGQWLTAVPTTAGTPVGPSFSAGWIDALKAAYGDAAHGGVSIYELGNEPNLWAETHHDLHPAATTYDELWARSRDLATAVKDADPTAATLGPAEWGWPNYFCSEADHVDQGCSPTSPDRAAHGGTDLSSWYLQQFAAAQAQTGRRLLDYFDLHYYPQGSYTPATDVTRSLWDPSYTDPSWIHAKIDLLPRMHGWVDQSYPGTELGLSEYNLGLDVTGSARLQNVIEADTLGIFGREGLDLATFWPEDSSPVPTWAFRIFRNYDGHHHGFGDVGVSATSRDQGRVAVYAARQGAHGALTVVLVNKSARAQRSTVALKHAAGATKAKGYQYAGKRITRVHHLRVRHHRVGLTLPAYSVTLVTVKLTK